MVSLSPCRSTLASLDVAALLQSSVVLLNGPTVFREFQTNQFIHRQIIGRPVRNVSVFGDHPEHSNRPETLQVNDGSRLRNHNLFHRLIPSAVQVDLEPLVDGEDTIAIRPDQANKVDATHDCFVFTRPV